MARLLFLIILAAVAYVPELKKKIEELNRAQADHPAPTKGKQ